jgi:ArsR family transcriptional regulator
MSKHQIDEIDRTSRVFKALSNAHRLRLFLRLASWCRPGTARCCSDCGDRGPTAYVGQLSHDLGIAPSTVSHHLKELGNAGLIRMRREGRNVACWVDADTLDLALAVLQRPATD